MSEERQSRRDKEDEKEKASSRRKPSIRSKSESPSLDGSSRSPSRIQREKNDQDAKRRAARPKSGEESLPGAIAMGTVAYNGKEGKKHDRREKSRAVVGTLFGLGILPGDKDEAATPVAGSSNSTPDEAKGNDTNVSPLLTSVPSLIPSAAPTFLAYPPLNPEECESLRLGQEADQDQDGTSLNKNFVFDFNVDLFVATESDLLLPEIENAIQNILMPKLAGCDDVQARRRMLKGIAISRMLESDPYKYIVSHGLVSAIGQKDGQCTIGDVDSAFCVPIEVELAISVKGDDLRSFQLIGRISTLFGNGIDIAEELNLRSPVRSLRLVGGRNLDPTAAPSMPPSMQPSTSVPTESPSASPSDFNEAPVSAAPTDFEETPVPTTPSSVSPTATLSEKPSVVPVADATPLPSSAPSMSPSMSPTMEPSSIPSQVLSFAPTVAFSTVPTSLPTITQSTAPSLVPTVMSRRTRIVHALESKGYPEQDLDLEILNWMADEDDWVPEGDDVEDDAYQWLERYAFTKIFEDTNGEDWVQSDNWKTPGVSVCSWYNLFCANETVTIADFFRNGLTGTLPTELGGLQSLTDIRINQWNSSTLFTHIDGSIPPSILALTNLKALWMHFNGVTSIGPEILALSNLEHLHLRGNPLDYFPIHIYELPNLEVLRLERNELDGTIPQGVAQLTKLRRVFFSSNRFRAPIPEELGDMTSLTFLSLGFNAFSTTIPSFIRRMTQLDELYIESAGMMGTVPDLGLLTNLRWLSFDDNRLVSPLPPFPTSLRSCVLTQNQFDMNDPNKGICTI